MTNPQHIFRLIWGLDFDGIAAKLEAIGRLSGDVIAGASALLVLLDSLAAKLDKHPRLKQALLGCRHTLATLALDTTAPLRRLLHRKPTVDLKGSAAAFTWVCRLQFAARAVVAGVLAFQAATAALDLIHRR